MAALKRLNNEIKKIEFNAKKTPYQINWINSYDDCINTANTIAKISISFYNKNFYLNMDIPNSYPFKPPSIWIETNTALYKNVFQRYDKWCGDITSIINNRNYLSQNNIFFAWAFSMSDNKCYTLNNVPCRLPLSCICCSSVSCYHNWNPSKKIEDIVEEFIFYKKFLFFSSQLGLKCILSIFNNDKWSIPEELILYILQFFQAK